MFKLYDYRPTQTKAFELVDGVFKKCHRGNRGKEFDPNKPKCRICGRDVVLKKEGISKTNKKYVTHFCESCNIYYNTFLNGDSIYDEEEFVDRSYHEESFGNPGDFGDFE